MVQNLGLNSVNRATIVADSTTANFKIDISDYATAPASGELPFIVLLTPSATNVTPCTITPSWGTTAYAIKDPKRNDNVQAGEIISGIPCYFLFDGTTFWYQSGRGLVANTDYLTPPARLTALPTSGTALTNNAEYRVSATVGTYAFAWPTSPFEVWLKFTTTSTPNITFPAGTKYVGGAPSFEASIIYEMSVKDGVVLCQEVTAT